MVNKKEPVPRMIKPVAMYLINGKDDMDTKNLFYLLTLFHENISTFFHFNEYKKDIPIYCIDESERRKTFRNVS